MFSFQGDQASETANLNVASDPVEETPVEKTNDPAEQTTVENTNDPAEQTTVEKAVEESIKLEKEGNEEESKKEDENAAEKPEDTKEEDKSSKADDAENVEEPKEEVSSVDDDDFELEKKLLTDVLMATGIISHAAVVSLKDEKLQASGPEGFIPCPDNVTHIIEAFNGDIMGLAENGVSLGCGLPVYIPGKILEGRIACSDGKGGGAVLYETKLSLIVVVFQKDIAVATRLGFKVADHLRKLNR